MAKHKIRYVDRRVSAAYRQRQAANPIQETQPRSIDTGRQMRDTLRVARADNARRFVSDVIAQRLSVLRHLEIEDLRRSRYVLQDTPRQTYRREDGRAAVVTVRSVRKTDVRGRRMPSQVRDVFLHPAGVLVCQRRQARRRVIFALYKDRIGGKSFRPAKWTDRSYIVCQRVR